MPNRRSSKPTNESGSGVHETRPRKLAAKLIGALDDGPDVGKIIRDGITARRHGDERKWHVKADVQEKRRIIKPQRVAFRMMIFNREPINEWNRFRRRCYVSDFEVFRDGDGFNVRKIRTVRIIAQQDVAVQHQVSYRDVRREIFAATVVKKKVVAIAEAVATSSTNKVPAAYHNFRELMTEEERWYLLWRALCTGNIYDGPYLVPRDHEASLPISVEGVEIHVADITRAPDGMLSATLSSDTVVASHYCMGCTFTWYEWPDGVGNGPEARTLDQPPYTVHGCSHCQFPPEWNAPPGYYLDTDSLARHINAKIEVRIDKSRPEAGYRYALTFTDRVPNISPTPDVMTDLPTYIHRHRRGAVCVAPGLVGCHEGDYHYLKRQFFAEIDGAVCTSLHQAFSPSCDWWDYLGPPYVIWVPYTRSRNVVYAADTCYLPLDTYCTYDLRFDNDGRLTQRIISDDYALTPAAYDSVTMWWAGIKADYIRGELRSDEPPVSPCQAMAPTKYFEPAKIEVSWATGRGASHDVIRPPIDVVFFQSCSAYHHASGTLWVFGGEQTLTFDFRRLSKVESPQSSTGRGEPLIMLATSRSSV